jgi:hypothetical protein
MTPPTNPIEALIQRQLEAYNANDVEALTDTYAENAQQFEHPNTLIATGRAEICARFAARFAENKPHATLINRIVAGNFVIDHEMIERNFGDGRKSVELVAMYEVVDGRIARAWFRFGG